MHPARSSYKQNKANGQDILGNVLKSATCSSKIK